MRLRKGIAAAILPALSCVAVLSIAGCGRMPGYPRTEYVAPDKVTDFATLYNSNCRSCHGAAGQNGPAIDLANPEYQALVDDATLHRIISNGMPGTQMPAWAQSAGGMLTDQQVDALVAGMRKEWARPNPFDGATPPPLEQPQSAIQPAPAAQTPAKGHRTGASAAQQAAAGDVQRGQQAYQAHCQSCHTGHARQELTSPVYLSLISDEAIRTIIIAGRPDIGQPDWRHDNGQLSPQDVTDIVAYLSSLRKPSQVSAAPVPLSARR